MARCARCGAIILGGVKDGGLRYGDDTCLRNAQLAAVALELPPEQVERRIQEVHAGPCPRCGRRGPVDVHRSVRMWSLLVIQGWSHRSTLGCRVCGAKRQMLDAFLTLLGGWWSFQGVLTTPLCVLANIVRLLRPPDPACPSSDLSWMVQADMLRAREEARNPLTPAQKEIRDIVKALTIE